MQVDGRRVGRVPNDHIRHVQAGDQVGQLRRGAPRDSQLLIGPRRLDQWIQVVQAAFTDVEDDHRGGRDLPDRVARFQIDHPLVAIVEQRDQRSVQLREDPDVERGVTATSGARHVEEVRPAVANGHLLPGNDRIAVAVRLPHLNPPVEQVTIVVREVDPDGDPAPNLVVEIALILLEWVARRKTDTQDPSAEMNRLHVGDEPPGRDKDGENACSTYRSHAVSCAHRPRQTRSETPPLECYASDETLFIVDGEASPAVYGVPRQLLIVRSPWLRLNHGKNYHPRARIRPPISKTGWGAICFRLRHIAAGFSGAWRGAVVWPAAGRR